MAQLPTAHGDANIQYPDGHVVRVTLLQIPEVGKEIVALQTLKEGGPWIADEIRLADGTYEPVTLYDVRVRT